MQAHLASFGNCLHVGLDNSAWVTDVPLLLASFTEELSTQFSSLVERVSEVRSHFESQHWSWRDGLEVN